MQQTSSPQALVELIDEDDLARRATFPEKAEIRFYPDHICRRNNLMVFGSVLNHKTFSQENLSFCLIHKQLSQGNLLPPCRHDLIIVLSWCLVPC